MPGFCPAAGRGGGDGRITAAAFPAGQHPAGTIPGVHGIRPRRLDVFYGDRPGGAVFGFGGYLDGIPAQGSGPVAAERVMEADEHRQFLQLSCYDQGLQVFLDDALLYTDFPQLENRADAFLSDADPRASPMTAAPTPAGKRSRKKASDRDLRALL